MNNTVELRSKPELKISLNEDGLEIIDASEPKNSGFYPYRQIRKIELNTERTDWFLSAFSWVLELFSGTTVVGGNFKNKANLKLEMVNRTLKIWLVNVDFKKAEVITEKIKTYTQQYL